jgi:hypothetical protein
VIGGHEALKFVAVAEGSSGLEAVAISLLAGGVDGAHGPPSENIEWAVGSLTHLRGPSGPCYKLSDGGSLACSSWAHLVPYPEVPDGREEGTERWLSGSLNQILKTCILFKCVLVRHFTLDKRQY